MNWLQAAEVKVGILVLVVGSLIAVMSMQVSDDPSYLSRSKKAWFLLDNAGGLIKNSAVRSAGIPVGVIKDVRLQDGRARIDITVKSEVELTTSAYVEIKAQGILGDKHVEVYPGSPTDPPLPDGAQILIVKDRGSLDNLVTSVSEVTGSLKDVADSLREAVTEDGTRKHVLGRIVKNIETLTQDLAEISSENKGKLSEIIDQVHDVTSSIQDVMKDESDNGFKATWARASNAVKNLEEVTDKINSGEGTIGKLINDETTVTELNTAIEGVSSIFDSVSRVQTGFDFRAEYLSEVQDSRTYIGLKIQPGLDRYYYLALVDDPAGTVNTERIETTDNNGGSGTDVTYRKTFQNKTKLTALFAKNFWDFTFKGGLIENTGGFGVDYSFFRQKMKFSVEAFDFAQTNVRASVTYNVLWGLYVTGGVHDALNKSDRRSSYLGAGLFLTNDDLKLLLSSSPF